MSDTKSTGIDPHGCTDDEICQYLTTCLAEDNGGASSVAKALANVARIQGMAQLADELEGHVDDLSLGMALRAMHALGFQLAAEQAAAARGK